MDIYLIGIGNHAEVRLSPDMLELIAGHNVFSGGKRHYNLVRQHLPNDHVWIGISADMPALMDEYQSKKDSIVVFVSGDPFFYGFGNTLKRLLPHAKLQAFPYFNSIQLLCQKTQANYNELKNVSVHGRDWSALDQVLIQDEPLIGVLTDALKTPSAIAKRMLQYGFGHYAIIVGEELEGNEERLYELTLDQCAQASFKPLNCMLLVRKQARQIPFGLMDEAFVPLTNRPNMITKMAVRLNTIQVLRLQSDHVFWDIGTCTGSIAIEAKRHYPSVEVVAFEIREECAAIIQQNMERFATPGIQVHIGDFFEQELSAINAPDVVFIGGHGNRLEEMIQLVHRLNPSVRLVINAVQEKTSSTFLTEMEKIEFEVSSTTLTVDDHNKISIHSGENKK